MDNTIFVQIASYRDPELVNTINSLLDGAQNPDKLTICIAHQYDDINVLNSFRGDKRFKILDIPFGEGQGACWARNLIQNEYNGEDYTLQLDSHHRFIKNWDVELIKMVEDLQSKGHKKPLITVYLPSFDPQNDPKSRVNTPWKMNFDRFNHNGVALFLPSKINGYEQLTSPIPARFYSAHFAFTLGQFCLEVSHDPKYYFHGEEISISVRAFTWGYDLFHPHKVIAWHEYTRKNRSKHWDDDKGWPEKDKKCQDRNRQLLMVEPRTVDFGKYDLGRERTLAHYEEYAGISFSKKAVQQYTLDNNTPPNPILTKEEFDKSLLPIRRHKINISSHKITEREYDFWVVAVHSKDGKTIYRKDLNKQRVKTLIQHPVDGRYQIDIEFFSFETDTYWVVWPHSESKGWGERLTGAL